MCNKCDHEAKLQEKFRRRRAGQGTRADSRWQTSVRVNPKHARYTARATETKIQKFGEYGNPGARKVSLISGMHAM